MWMSCLFSSKNLVEAVLNCLYTCGLNNEGDNQSEGEADLSMGNQTHVTTPHTI